MVKNLRVYYSKWKTKKRCW